MAEQQETMLAIGDSISRALRSGAKKLGASEAELASIQRLESGIGQTVDVKRLQPLAISCGLPWVTMWRRLTNGS